MPCYAFIPWHAVLACNTTRYSTPRPATTAPYASADGSELMAAHAYHEQQQYITNIGEDIVEFYQQLGTSVTHKSRASHTRARACVRTDAAVCAPN